MLTPSSVNLTVVFASNSFFKLILSVLFLSTTVKSSLVVCLVSHATHEEVDDLQMNTKVFVYDINFDYCLLNQEQLKFTETFFLFIYSRMFTDVSLSFAGKLLTHSHSSTHPCLEQIFSKRLAFKYLFICLISTV